MEPSAASQGTNPCPICLGPIVQESYLDTCFHKFCYNCIVQWTKVVASKQSLLPSSVKCPLCKTENYSLIRGFDGTSFERHYVNRNFGDSFLFTKAHKFRLQCYYTEPVNYVFNQEEDVEIIVHHILGVFDSFLRRNGQNRVKTPETIREEFKALVSDAARPFISARTNRFIDEMELFLASGLNIEAYDQVYGEQLGWNTPSASDNTAEESNENTPVVPYLYIFDEDSDGSD